MAAYRVPGLYLETVDPPDRSVTPLRTDIAAFVGLAQRGPVFTPTAVTSREQFSATFGQPVPGYYLAHAAQGFFLNGGRTLYVVRVVNPDTAAVAGSTLANTAGTPTLAVAAADEGAWANGLAVTVEPARKGAGRTTAWAPAGDWAELSSTTGFDPGSLVKVRDGGITRYGVVARLDGSRLFWAEPFRPPAGGADVLLETCEFHLKLQLGPETEAYFFVSPHRDHPTGYESAVNAESRLIRLVPDDPARPAADLLPVGQQVVLAGGRDGWEGLTSAHFADALAALEAADDVSIVAVPDVGALTPPATAPPAPYVPRPPEPAPPPAAPCACPADPPPPPARRPPPAVDPVGRAGKPLLDETNQESVRLAVIEHCEALGTRFAIVDPPPDLEPQAVLTWRESYDSMYAGLYYPWLLIQDPNRDGESLAVPPSGHVAGIYARSDRRTGVHKAPANEAVSGVLALAYPARDAEQALLNPSGVNCLRVFPARGAVVWGARTLSSSASWRFVNVRRLVIMVKRAVAEATPWAVFEPHNLRLRFQLVNALSTFLEGLWRAGALAGATPQEAFLVKCDNENNPPEVVDAGMIVIDVLVAPARPAEFVVVRVERSRDATQVREVELG